MAGSRGAREDGQRYIADKDADLRVTANANGEWGWLTDVVDLPIAEALADLLLGGGPS